MRHSVLVTAHIILVRDGRVLMLRRANTGFMDGWYSLPAGHLEAGESLLAAAARELREETGVVVLPEQLAFHALTHLRTDDREYIHTFFRALSWEGTPTNREPSKCDELAWWPCDGMPENVVPYVRAALVASPGSTLLEGWP